MGCVTGCHWRCGRMIAWGDVGARLCTSARRMGNKGGASTTKTTSELARFPLQRRLQLPLSLFVPLLTEYDEGQ